MILIRELVWSWTLIVSGLGFAWQNVFKDHLFVGIEATASHGASE